MLKKSYTKTGNSCRVTFKLPADVSAESAALVGDFNNWNPEANPMKKLKDGTFSTTVSLPAGESYRVRYLLDGERWENDGEADTYAANQYGREDLVVKL